MSKRSYTRIVTGEEGKVFKVILSRPEKHNAFDDITILELIEAFREASTSDRIRVVLLKAEGKNFCAGADLEWMRRARTFTLEENRQDALRLAEMVQGIFSMPVPVICRVHGAVFGGGVGLVAACDIVIASEEATFSLSEVKVGIAPATIYPILLRKIGESVCRRIMLTGEQFGAVAAKEFGLVHKVVSVDLLDDAVQDVVSMILQNGPQAIASCKELALRVPSMTLVEAKEFTTEMIARLRLSDEGQEGLTAFLEKRKPKWTE
ncbi:MAG: enoyl-CoA hydratase-related protein [Acidobacteriota bacterium]